MNGRPKRALGAIALGLCAVGLAVGSGADFSASSYNPDNTFRSGTLTIDNSREGTSVMNVSDLKPGGTPRTATVDIRNGGSLPGDFTLAADLVTSNFNSTDGSPPFNAKLWIQVRDCGAYAAGDSSAPACGDSGETIVFRNSLSDLKTPVSAGRFAPGERHRYEFSSWLDASAGNQYQGVTASSRFVWRATQAPDA
jgi:hypothetical protein